MTNITATQPVTRITVTEPQTTISPNQTPTSVTVSEPEVNIITGRQGPQGPTGATGPAGGVTLDTAQTISGDKTFSGAVNQPVFAATIAALTAATTPADGTVVFVAGFASDGDGGQGYFKWDSASTDTDDGGLTLQPDAGGTGRWKRQWGAYGEGVLPEWFGAVGDASTDDADALTASAAAAGSNGVSWDLSRRYRSSQAITVSAPTRIRGSAAGFSGGASPSTTAPSGIVFDAGVSGLVFETGAQYSSLEHLEIESASSEAGNDVGVTVNCRRFYGESVNVSGFGSHGWLIEGNSPTTNANHGCLVSCRAHDNFGDGFHFTGSDANLWTLVSPDAFLNGGRGYFLDTTVFTTTTVQPHAIDNGSSGQSAPTVGALMSTAPTIGDYVDAGGSNVWIAPYAENTAGYNYVLWIGGNYTQVYGGSFGAPVIQFKDGGVRLNATVHMPAGYWGHQRIYDIAGSGSGHTYIHFSGQVAANAYSLRDDTAGVNVLRWDPASLQLTVGGKLRLASSTGPLIVSGTADPSSVISAPVGSLFLRTDGGADTTLYVKESGGSGSSGWVAK